MSKATLLPRLKEETRAEHELLEQQLDLLRPDITLADYRALLEAFYGFYVPWERAAAPILGSAVPDFFAVRSKVSRLQRDLRHFGIDTTSLPEAQSLPDVSSHHRVLGSVYVFEGATLGGQLLARHFARTLGLSREHGCAFFTGYGADTGARWRSFCELLVSRTSPENEDATVAAAKETFTSFRYWLRQRGILVLS